MPTKIGPIFAKLFHKRLIFEEAHYQNKLIIKMNWFFVSIFFIWTCSFLAKNLSNFVSPSLKLHNRYCHTTRNNNFMIANFYAEHLTFFGLLTFEENLCFSYWFNDKNFENRNNLSRWLNLLWYLFSVESPAPSKSSLNVISGPTHITLDWGAPQEGWMTSYKVHVEPAKV